MNTVLVTGAGGYIGSSLVPKLLEKGYRVKALDRFFFGEDKLVKHENVEIIKDDCRRMKEEYFNGVDAVIDLAAISNDSSGELFKEATYHINFLSRVHTAQLAKKMGVKRYILPSSCSVYGFQDGNGIADETSQTNPLTTYAQANALAERGVLLLADDSFTVVVMRQATVFGYSPRIRLDLAINGMVYGAWEKGKIPLMRDGSQWRPFVHIQDTIDVMCLLLTADDKTINGEIFNVGSDENNYQLMDLANGIISALPIKVEIEWYGDPDHRSYRINFKKLEKRLNWKAKWTIAQGAQEIYTAIEQGKVRKTPQTITLEWYKELVKWHQMIKEVEKYGGILDI